MASSGEVHRSLQAVAQRLRWTYAILWQLCPDQGALVWAEGHYNGAIKTRKTVQPAVAQAQAPAPAAEAADQARSRQLRELFDSLAREAAAGGGTGFRDVHGCAQEARRPSAALAPEDLTETEWFYLMSASYSFPPGVGLPGRAFARGGHVWLSRANEVDSKAFSRAILARSAGIKTVVCIPIIDGVMEIGTTEKVEEDMGLVQYAMAIFMDQQETHMIPSICHSNQTSHIDQQSLQTHTGQTKPEPNKFDTEYEDDEMEYDDDDEIDAGCTSGSASHDDHATHNAGSSELMQVEMSERVRDGCSSNLGDEIQMLMVCQNGTSDHSNLHGQDEAWHFLYEELCSGYPQSSGENQSMAENAHYAHTVTLILHRNNALRQANGLNTRSYLAVSHQSSFSRWDAGIHGRTVAQGTTRQKMVKSVLLFFSAACNKPPGDLILRCDEAGARREVDFGASHVMQERKRREKLNERFIILRSLVPFVTKMDKASILGDTIEYVKQLTKRIQDLESSTVRGAAMPKEKRTLLTGKEGASSSSGSSSSAPLATDVQVSIIESDALLELRCPDRRGLLVTIMQALQEQLRLEVTSVQASSDHGVLLAEMRAKVQLFLVRSSV
ncbi:truncated basic helix-loop-helix protein A-like [Triticum aestivum]|uniref:truncated basic helix-loop-helix protein A-like n=1 Tax=Triticum aestivum TaxID=4565 RepID=UPI001D00CA20|nr:truncated basic helix-loop-helix protein A-like [Triticum aestivum]